MTHSAFEKAVDRNALTSFLRLGYIGEGHSIYEGVQKLPPAMIAEVSFDQPDPVLSCYWSLPEIAARPVPTRSVEDMTDELEALLKKVVRRQLLTDVPLGAFLSGGIDSSLVVALMQSQSAQPVRTFSIGFHEKRYDEAPEARAISTHLGTTHEELYISNEDLLDAVPRMAEIYDEPFADNSQIPTWLVCRMARQHVTVALTGDGGDEFFGGYDRYRQGAALLRRTRALPPILKKAMGRTVSALPAHLWDMLLLYLRKVPQGKEPNGQWAHRMGAYLETGTVEDLHHLLVSRWRDPTSVVLSGREAESCLTRRPSFALPDRGLSERMMLLDQLTYLPGDLMTKTDRAAMAVSLETRAPLLDHEVAEFSWALPESMKLGSLGSKDPLRRVLYRYVPQVLLDRPKKGFEVPIGLWLRGPLREWAEALLAPDRVNREGWFDSAQIQTIWQQHLSCRYNHGLFLWNVLMFQAWQETH